MTIEQKLSRGSFGAGVFTMWEHKLWKSFPFWILVLKISTCQTLLVFVAINAFRFFLRHWQKQGECEESSTV